MPEIILNTLRKCRNWVRKKHIEKDIVSYSKRKYYRVFGKEPDLVNPKSFNEKTLWIAIFYHNPLYTKCADKILVREYVESKLGKEETNNLFCKKYGYWDDPSLINFDNLPNSFVLKSNHASAQVIICEDKSLLNVDKTIKQMSEWLKLNHYFFMGEWQYKNIKPQIICEELLDSHIVDYRIFCFEGKPTYIKVTRHSTSSAGGYDYNMYYPDWTQTEFRMEQNYGHLDFEKPEQLDYMLQVATILSQDFHFVRVDFFITKQKVYFAELTFTPNSGCEKYTDFEVDKRFGNMFELPNDEYVEV